MPLPLVERNLIENFILISDERAVEVARKLAKQEGIFAGFSSGANVAAALELLKSQERGQNIAVIIDDIGLKYMSNDLFS